MKYVVASKFLAGIARNLTLALAVTTCASAMAAKDQSGARERAREKIADKLPSKAISKRTYVDFSREEAAVVISPRASELDRILKTSDRDLKSASNSSVATTTVRSRKILAAPEGDSAEPISAMTTATPAPKISAKLSAKAQTVTPATVSPAPALAQPLQIEKIETQFVGPILPPTPVRPPVQFEPFEEFPETAKAPRSVIQPTSQNQVVMVDVQLEPNDAVVEKDSAPTTAPRSTTQTRFPRRELGDGFFKKIDSKSMVFIRGGYFNANYKKFDDRMKNGATSIGIAAARALETTWGEFEVRAAFDVYHPLDQSVTIDNVRMFTARTEVAYWFSHSRVKPGLSLGLGMADYSIRSYRSIADPNESLVTLKTHAKSRAFSVIPATSLRVELAEELVIDTQTEFLALLGGDDADAAQGLGLTVSLGWMF